MKGFMHNITPIGFSLNCCCKLNLKLDSRLLEQGRGKCVYETSFKCLSIVKHKMNVNC